MKFIKQHPVFPPNGTKEIKRWFAWLPIQIDDETRWLETVTVELEFDEGYGSFVEPSWIAMRFIN